jgi:hypothetical protein
MNKTHKVNSRNKMPPTKVRISKKAFLKCLRDERKREITPFFDRKEK